MIFCHFAFRHLHKRVFRRIISEIHKLWGSSRFSKCSKLNGDLRNAGRNWEKTFSAWDNWIWIGCFKISLLSTECLSPGVNVWTNSLKILDTTETDIFNFGPNHHQRNKARSRIYFLIQTYYYCLGSAFNNCESKMDRAVKRNQNSCC